MIINIAKSLDRPVDIFGVKGSWIKVFLIFVGASVFIGFISGSMTSSGVGISVAIVGVIIGFIFCQVVQAKVPHRHIDKFPLAGKVKCYIRRKETLTSILLPDERYVRLQQLKKEKQKNS